jgi:FtsP/CotA-like multicopper oxidase with cupredoxin domain
MKDQFARRDFIRMMGLSTGAVGAAALVNPTAAFASSTLADLAQQREVDWEEIDRKHEERVKIFLDNIGKDDEFWRKPLEYTMDGDVKVFEITCTEIEWETEAGKSYPAFSYNGLVPGPEFRVTEGDKLRINVHNEMGQSTTIHWHGVDVPNDQDGVPFVTQPPIKPGESYTYEFTAPNPGSHMYHSHHNSLEQVVGGLLGAFIIEPLNKRLEPRVDHDYTMILSDSILGFIINGKSFPYTQPLTAKVGERIRIRYMNEGLMIHPMHLHGQPQLVIAKDGYDLPAPYFADTLNIAPGERYDVIVEARAVGVWAFHCHILSHVENRDGLFGMVTPLIISE